MAEAEPTIRYTARAGKPVVEVGGAWTVFSLRGIRQKAARALQAAGLPVKTALRAGGVMSQAKHYGRMIQVRAEEE